MTGQGLQPGDVFAVSEELIQESVTYLKFADGRGWVFDNQPEGVLCLRHGEAFVPGRTVTILEAFTVGSAGSIELRCGMTGIVKRVDDDGNANISFGHNTQWISWNNLPKLRLTLQGTADDEGSTKLKPQPKAKSSWTKPR